MNKIAVMRGKPEYYSDFVELDLISGPDFLPYFFGSKVRDILGRLFMNKGNWWSFEHSIFAKANDRIAGMALSMSYGSKVAEEKTTARLIKEYRQGSTFNETPNPTSMDMQGQLRTGDYYLMNLAVYPQFRGQGLGTKLLERTESMAREAASKRIVLEVETDSEAAIKLYESLGYTIESKSPIVEAKVRNFELFKMVKEISTRT